MTVSDAERVSIEAGEPFESNPPLERADGESDSDRFDGIRRLGVAFDVYDVIDRLGSIDLAGP